MSPCEGTPSSTDGCPEYPLPVKAGQIDPVVVHIYNVNASAATTAVSVWSSSDSPSYFGR